MNSVKGIEGEALSSFEIEQPMGWRPDRNTALIEVIDEANRLVEGDIADVLGTLFVKRRRYLDEAFNGLHVCSQSLPAFGNAQFQHNTGSSCATVPAWVLVSGIADEANYFCNNRKIVAGIAREANSIATDVLSASRTVRIAPKLGAIGVSPTIGRDGFRTILTIEALGDGLILGPDTVDVPSSDVATLKQKLGALLQTHARRVDLLARHQASCSHGLIDQTAQCVMSSAGMDLEFALDQLERRRRLQFRFEDGRMRGFLEWKDDVLTGKVFEPDNKAYVWEGTFTVRRKFPHAICTALIGKPLSAVIERPYFPHGAIITSVYDFGDDMTRLDLKIPTEPFPMVNTDVRNALT